LTGIVRALFLLRDRDLQPDTRRVLLMTTAVAAAVVLAQLSAISLARPRPHHAATPLLAVALLAALGLRRTSGGESAHRSMPLVAAAAILLVLPSRDGQWPWFLARNNASMEATPTAAVVHRLRQLGPPPARAVKIFESGYGLTVYAPWPAHRIA